MDKKNDPFFKDYIKNSKHFKHFEFIQWFVNAIVDDVYCDILESMYGEIEVLAEWVLKNNIDYKNSDIITIWIDYNKENRTPREINQKLKSYLTTLLYCVKNAIGKNQIKYELYFRNK